MARKQALKQKAYVNQNGRCALSSKKLKLVYELTDTHRTVPRTEGGIYTQENTKLVDPVEHMKHHGNYREREGLENEIKQLVDSREQILKFKNKVGNQLIAFESRKDNLNQDFVQMLEADLNKSEKEAESLRYKIEKKMKEVEKYHPLIKAASNLNAVGYITLAYCFVYIDITKARHPSSLWKYVGYHVPSYNRYKKGQKGGGNKALRTALYNMGVSQVIYKNKGASYGDVYINRRKKTDNGHKYTWSMNAKKEWVWCKWKDAKPKKRYQDAIRKVAKHFLADYWYVGRTIYGLETNPTYAEAQLGMGHKTINPKERGWEF